MGLAYPCQFCSALSGLLVGMVKFPAKVGSTVLDFIGTLLSYSCALLRGEQSAVRGVRRKTWTGLCRKS